MSPEVREAIESARTATGHKRHWGPPKRRAFADVRQIVLAVVSELPEEMTIRELCEELGNANSQFEDQGEA
jgi:hypothetical protein